MKVFVVYSCYSESYEDPSIYFEVCGTIEKAQEIFEGYKTNILKQAKDCYDSYYDGEEQSFEDIYPVDEGTNTFEVREMDGDKAWESYIVEQELLV